MKFKNFIISVILILSLISSYGCEASASAVSHNPVVIYPADGSVVYDNLEKIKFSIHTQCRATVYLDGNQKTAYAEDGLFCVYVDEDFSVGIHTFEVVCEDGGSGAKSTFRFAKTSQSDFVSESFDGGQAGKMQFNSKLKVGTNASGEDVYLVPGLYKGKDGDENGAVGIYRDALVSDITVNNRTSTYIYLYVPSYPLTGRVILEYDIRVDGGCECGIETKNVENQFGTIGSSRLFGADGYIKDTDFEYKKGEWMHVRHIVDVPNGV